MDAGWAVRRYTTLNALCNEWTACIQQQMGDELGAGGYTGQGGKGRRNEGENEGSRKVKLSDAFFHLIFTYNTQALLHLSTLTTLMGIELFSQ
ncbi:hypothetical protein T12_14066 [Trichinella patagoniensis]|uniref:Uncharacterized protein n=1 Tax=Trichinella patagoniensis TaxID=990121 RepID=A0A0V0Z263_9BILA|nr:hypothetical protein T12_14066 [Trichinella patagoniensis]